MANTIWVSASAAARGTGTEGSPFQTIQDAINASKAGTTIMVKAGTYTENLVFRTSGTADAPIKLVSAGGPGAATITPKADKYDTIAIGGTDHIVVDGFKIQAPTTTEKNGIAIYAKQSTGVFDVAHHITITNNTIIGGEGDGIKGSKAEYLTITNNTISGTTGGEEAIDFVGVNHSVISGNKISDIEHIGIVVKGGSDDIKIMGNAVSGTGSSGIEVGGYTELPFYWPGFLGKQAYEIKNVVVSGNDISDTGGTGLRFIGAQNVTVSGNEISNVGNYIITIDDSAKFHSVWKSQDIKFTGNSVESGDWLENRSAGGGITQTGTFLDGRDLPVVKTVAPSVTAPAAATAKPAAVVPATPVQDAAPQVDGVRLNGGANRDQLNGSDRSDSLIGNGGNDKIVGKNGHDFIDGGAGNDELRGDSGNDTIMGGVGNDKITGGDGNDKLYGGAGTDHLDGGNGNDKLDAGIGNDSLRGGKGNDQFIFNENCGNDTITDFTAGDLVVFSIKGVNDMSDLRFTVTGRDDLRVSFDNGHGQMASLTIEDVGVNQLDSHHFLFT